MRENEPYKIIKQLLEQMHLKPGKKDWEQMQDLLNRNMPVHKPAHWFKSSRYFFAGGLVATVAILIVIFTHKNVSSEQQKRTEQSKTVIDSIRQQNAETNTTLNEINGKNKNDTANNENNNVNSYVQADTVGKVYHDETDITTEEKNAVTTLHKPVIKNNFNSAKKAVTKNRNNTATADKNKNVPATNKENSKNNDVPIINKNQNEITSSESNKTSKQGNTIQNDTGKKLNPVHDNAALQSITKTNDTTNASSAQKTKTVAAKKMKQGKHTSSFNYGLQLSPLQYFLSPADKKLGVSFIPGLYGEYLFSKKAGIHIGISPYQSTNLSNTNIFTDSTSNNDTTLTSEYYLNQLRVFTADFSLVYKQNNFSIEAGLGIQPVLSGKGKIISNRYINTSGVSQITQDVIYHHSDVAFKTVNKNTLYYHFNILYNFSQGQLGMGYYQDTKKWINNSALKPVGRIELQVRYNLSGIYKKK